MSVFLFYNLLGSMDHEHTHPFPDFCAAFREWEASLIGYGCRLNRSVIDADRSHCQFFKIDWSLDGERVTDVDRSVLNHDAECICFRPDPGDRADEFVMRWNYAYAFAGVQQGRDVT
ncbi:hypothetical protein C5O79_11045 [Burkholderia sp. SRS-25]|nr:hypothetical protein C5O79_11045 [Burkholderia sp. SRS-25]